MWQIPLLIIALVVLTLFYYKFVIPKITDGNEKAKELMSAGYEHREVETSLTGFTDTLQTEFKVSGEWLEINKAYKIHKNN